MHRLDEIYKNTKHTASLTPPELLYVSAKEKFPDIKKAEVIDYLHGQESYTLHVLKPNRFPRRKILVKKPGTIVGIDSAYVTLYSKSNNGVKYLIIFIDMYSRYLTIAPAKTLKGREMKEILENFFKENIYKYSKAQTDLGKEFTGKVAEEVFKCYNIERYSTESREIKVSICERVIRTIKSKIHKYISLSNCENYLKVLPDIVANYNRTKHTGLLNNTPLDIDLMQDNVEIIKFTSRMYKYHAKKIKTHSLIYKSGQCVRLKALSSSQNTFRRGYHIRNTKEIFKIGSVNEKHIPPTYNIIDLEGEPVKGIFYREELVPVKCINEYKIDIIKKRKRKGKTEYLVRYVDYPNSENIWTAAKDIV